MSYLSREAAPFGAEFWGRVDQTVTEAARRTLVGRRFVPIFGPLGIGTGSVPLDDAETLSEEAKDGFVTTAGRRYAELPLIYEDFTLLSRDLESSRQTGIPADLSRAERAAQACALREDRLIFYGDDTRHYEGLLTAAGTGTVQKKDWAVGENAYSDVASGVELLLENRVFGSLALAVSPDLYVQLQRIQPGTGVLEIDRIAKLLGSPVYRTPVLGRGKAVLVCPEAENIDLAVGQDIATAYLEEKDLNHSFRVLETVLFRIKRRKAVVVFE